MLVDWEKTFERAIQQVKPVDRGKSGALLPVTPDHIKWDDFTASIKAEWENWENDLWQHPACLVLLYCGLAFYEYEDNTFWPQFSKSVGSKPFSPNQQNEINSEFAIAAQHFGLKLKPRGNGTDFVGSAVQYIGIPLSLWDGFLDICEWVRWREDWKTLSNEEWTEAIEKRTGGRRRLKRFLIDNRESASGFVQEILDVREILTADPSQTINDIAQASILRLEYFDEVPETAEFLCPQNPDSLFQDRVNLVWDEHRREIFLQLPAVKRQQLPATWRVETQIQSAVPSPDNLVLNSAAFHDPLLLTFESGNHSEPRRLRGLQPWGLFDRESGGRLINPNRDELPLKSYVLVSKSEIEVLAREGFDESESQINQQYELADGITCFVTPLWPTGKWAELQLREQNGTTRTIRFKTRAKIEARFFAGKSEHAAYFSRIQDKVKIEQWPVLCVLIPRGYFRDNKVELDRRFKVFIGDKSAGGQWENPVTQTDDDREFYFWRWSSDRPVIEQVKSGTAKSFRELRSFFHSPSLKGDRILSIKSPEFTVQYKIYKDDPKPGMGKCWKNLPGSFLPMFLLCQSIEGMKWEDLVLAKDVIAPNLRFLPYILHKYAHHGFLVQRGHRWLINESRAELRPMESERCQLNYCGDPSILWSLYRLMYHKKQDSELPVIDVINRRGEIPYLQMIWPLRLRRELEEYLRHNGVVIGEILWTH